MAAPLWNSRILTSPPFLHLPVTSVIGDNATIKQYETTVTDITTELNLLQVFEKEIWIFQRILQKYQNSERHMKWFRESKMICKTGERLLQLKLPDIAAALLPVKEQDSTSDYTSCRWPSCQMLQFFLVRLIGFSGLCQYIWSMGYKTNELLLQNMELKILFYRHFCKLSVISRMQVICQNLLEKCCEWYTALYPWLQCLPELESHWLPDGVTLPDSVEEILGDKLKELRNIVSKSNEVPSGGKKSTLEKVFGSDPELLPRFVLEEDVTMRSAKKAVGGPGSSVDMSLDDIFDGLVEDQLASKVTDHSMTSSKLPHERNEQVDQRGGSANPASITSVDGSATRLSGMIGGARDAHEENKRLQLEDLGVPMCIEDRSRQISAKKKRKKNRNPDQSVNGKASLHEEPIRGSPQKLKRKREHLPVEDVEVHATAEECPDQPEQRHKKRRRKSDGKVNYGDDERHGETGVAAEDGMPHATVDGLEISSRLPSLDHPVHNQTGHASRDRRNLITGKENKRRKRKNKR